MFLWWGSRLRLWVVGCCRRRTVARYEWDGSSIVVPSDAVAD